VTSPAAKLSPFVRRQNGAVTVAQALAVGVSHQQLRTLLASGWSRPVYGVLVEPSPANPFFAGLRAALLARPGATACRTAAARVHKLAGLPLWKPAELPAVILPAGTKRAQRSGMRTYYGLAPGQRIQRSGFWVTTLAGTVAQVAQTMAFDDLICLLDSALSRGWSIDDHPISRRRRVRLSLALAMADGRSESTLESHLRLLLVRAGVGPEVLQLELCRDGRCYARLDMAWPSRKLAVEADGRETHEKPAALLEDRRRQNRIMIDKWTVLRFTWSDVRYDRDWVVSQVREALATA
jgi:Protein of unknown function (DUF559)